MIFFILCFCFFVADGLPFIPLHELKDCPNIPVMKGLRTEQISGSWRLAYLFYDEEDQIDEDGSCIVGEFSPISENQISIAVHMDFKEGYIIDRTSFDLVATFHTPGQWLLHSNASHRAYLHVKVIHLTDEHMILTICISNATNTDDNSVEDWGFNYILHKLTKDENLKYSLKNEKLHVKDDISNDLSSLFGRKSYIRRKRSWHEKFEEISDVFASKTNMREDEHVKEKHFWTIILTKDNNISAYNFVENAALLMKFGFDMRKGNLVAFGKCDA